MENEKNIHNTAKIGKPIWVKYMLIALIFEKSIQHIFVTVAFYLNWGNIGATVAVNPRILMILGAIVAILFILSLWGSLLKRSGQQILLLHWLYST